MVSESPIQIAAINGQATPFFSLNSFTLSGRLAIMLPNMARATNKETSEKEALC